MKIVKLLREDEPGWLQSQNFWMSASSYIYTPAKVIFHLDSKKHTHVDDLRQRSRRPEGFAMWNDGKRKAQFFRPHIVLVLPDSEVCPCIVV